MMADNEMTAAIPAEEPADAEGCFSLGMIYSSGAGVAVDLVQAHKWFNIAAMRGHNFKMRIVVGNAQKYPANAAKSV